MFETLFILNTVQEAREACNPRPAVACIDIWRQSVVSKVHFETVEAQLCEFRVHKLVDCLSSTPHRQDGSFDDGGRAMEPRREPG